MSTQSAIDLILNGPLGNGYEVLTTSGATPYKETNPSLHILAEVERRQLIVKKDGFRNQLQVGSWVVEFTKVDGTPSVMECTLDSRLIPEATHTGAGRPAPQDADYIRVYALDRQGWRSFKVANVTRFYQGA